MKCNINYKTCAGKFALLKTTLPLLIQIQYTMKRKLFLVLFFSGIFYAGVSAQNQSMCNGQFEEPFAERKHNNHLLSKVQASLNQLYDSIYYWDWDTPTTGW